jgi:hypothetical protein
LDAPQWLVAFATSLDIVTFWVLILLTIGCVIVGRTKRGNAAVAVWGWWFVITLVKVVTAAIF